MDTTQVEQLPSDNLYLDSKSNLVKIPLAKKGSWVHPSYGTISFSDEDFESLEANFKENRLGFTPYITFGHLDEEPNSTDSHRKRGNLNSYVRENETLFGLFEAKPEAFEEVKAGNYEFASGEFIRNFTDKETGNQCGLVFERAALTNSPFIPFEEKDKAIALSNNSYSCFKLSMGVAEVVVENPTTEETLTEEPQIEPELKSEVEVIAESDVTTEPTPTVSDIEEQEVIPQLINKEEDMTTVLEQETIKDEVVEVATSAEVKQEVEAPTEALITNPTVTQAPQVDIEAIVAKAIEGVRAQYENEFTSLKSELETQQKLSNQFSARLAHEERVALSQSLTSMGVPPVLVDRLHEIKQALSTNSQSIKLSQGESTVEVDLFKAITQLVTDSLGIQFVDETQQGASKGASNEFVDSIKAITERNRKLVKA